MQSMDSKRFREWRKANGLKQKDAADKLGLKKRVIQYYEKGDRDGRPVEIPKSVELACLALALGHESYDGGPVGRGSQRIAPERQPKPADATEEKIEVAPPA